ncbi:MAG TPA: hypothetical protein PLD25_17290 [Chloroflexota bacterium]|nr:hypothetical protein [Chloroflexota bacterium]HUM72294.1 hypothetical protein [Chloroflexota bacterium]
MEAREHAEALIGYFKRLSDETGEEIWKYGLETSQEWRRVIVLESAPLEQVMALVGIVHANGSRSSGWHDLSHGVYFWASQNGYPVPEFAEFFGTSRATHEAIRDLLEGQISWHDYANVLIAQFKDFCLEDPNQTVWKAGLDTALRWQEQIDGKPISQTQVLSLINHLTANDQRLDRYGGTELDALTSGICDWIKGIGYYSLLPEGLQRYTHSSS